MTEDTYEKKLPRKDTENEIYKKILSGNLLFQCKSVEIRGEKLQMTAFVVVLVLDTVPIHEYEDEHEHERIK